MKRELKPSTCTRDTKSSRIYCRAYPDEKGIETDPEELGSSANRGPIAEPIPMKRELKPYPTSTGTSGYLMIAEPIPMKRELKHYSHANGQAYWI